MLISVAVVHTPMSAHDLMHFLQQRIVVSVYVALSLLQYLIYNKRKKMYIVHYKLWAENLCDIVQLSSVLQHRLLTDLIRVRFLNKIFSLPRESSNSIAYNHHNRSLPYGLKDLVH